VDRRNFHALAGHFLGNPYSDSVDLHGSAAEGYADHDACGAAPTAPPPPPPPAQIVKVKPQVHLMQNNQLVQPKVIPGSEDYLRRSRTRPQHNGYAGGVPAEFAAAGSMGGVLGGVIGGVAGPPPPHPTQSRIRQGGAVTAASLINKVTRSILAGAADACGWDCPFARYHFQARHGPATGSALGHPLLVQSALTPSANGGIVQRSSMVNPSKSTPLLTSFSL